MDLLPEGQPPGKATMITHLFARPLRTDEEVCYGQYWTNKWNIHINMHIGCLYKFPVRLTAIPIVRSRKVPLNLEILCETLAEIIERLHVAVRPVYTPATVAEVRIRYDKYAVVIQELRYFSEFLGLEGPHIFKNTLGNDDVETLLIKPNWRLEEVSLDQIRRRVMYGYIDAIVLDI